MFSYLQRWCPLLCCEGYNVVCLWDSRRYSYLALKFTVQKVRPKRKTVIPLDRSLVTLSLKEKNCLIWRPNENGLTDVGFAGVIEHPAWAKLTPVRKFGAPREFKYALRSGISIASTAEVYEQEWDCRQQNSWKGRAENLVLILKNIDAYNGTLSANSNFCKG